MTVHLCGEVNYGMLDNLLKALNDLKSGDALNVYFSSEGGDADVGEAIIDLINKNKRIIIMTFYGEIFSAGMNIFLKSECSRRILPDTRGMFHFAWQTMAVSEGGKITAEYDKFSMSEMKNSEKRTIDFLKTTAINEKEIARIKKGQDVYFSHGRLIELLNGRQIQ